MVPVLSCNLIDLVPDKDPRLFFRGAAANAQEAKAAAEDLVSLWLKRQNRSQGAGPGRIRLEQRRYSIQYYPDQGQHNRWVAELTNYVCYLERWSVLDCVGKGATMQKAKNDAAQKLLEGQMYCMVWLRDRR
ncbi:hypothetical protein FRC08_003491 [Ceratobasidium sp. 394]|nr:hypothetical protein FRC08_003491 [Ceratobasidium sp. 394]